MSVLKHTLLTTKEVVRGKWTKNLGVFFRQHFPAQLIFTLGWSLALQQSEDGNPQRCVGAEQILYRGGVASYGAVEHRHRSGNVSIRTSPVGSGRLVVSTAHFPVQAGHRFTVA